MWNSVLTDSGGNGQSQTGETEVSSNKQRLKPDLHEQLNLKDYGKSYRKSPASTLEVETVWQQT